MLSLSLPNGPRDVIHMAAPLRSPSLAYMDDHMVLGRALLPAAAMLELSSGALQTLLGDPTSSQGAQQGLVSGMAFTSPFILDAARRAPSSPATHQQILQIAVDPSGAFQLQSWGLSGDGQTHTHARGTLAVVAAPSLDSSPDGCDPMMTDNKHGTNSAAIGSQLVAACWMDLGCQDESSAGPIGALAAAVPIDGYILAPQALDATLHLGVTHPASPAKVPTSVAAYAVPSQACTPGWGVGTLPYGLLEESPPAAGFVILSDPAGDGPDPGQMFNPVGPTIRGMGTKAMRLGASGRQVGGHSAAVASRQEPQLMYEMVAGDQVVCPLAGSPPGGPAVPRSRWSSIRPAKCMLGTARPTVSARLRGHTAAVRLPAASRCQPLVGGTASTHSHLGKAAALLQALQQVPAALEATPDQAASIRLELAGDAAASTPTQQQTTFGVATGMMGTAASEIPAAVFSLHTHSSYAAGGQPVKGNLMCSPADSSSGHPLAPSQQPRPGLNKAAAGQGTLAQPLLLPSGHMQAALQGHTSLRVVPKPRGSLQSLVAEPLDADRSAAALKPDEVTVAVHAVGLNFRDVLNVLGKPYFLKLNKAIDGITKFSGSNM